jgi:RND family efflux transporter MFP subunit
MNTQTTTPSTGPAADHSKAPNHDPSQNKGKRPIGLVLFAAVLIVVILIIGIIPRMHQNTALAQSVKEASSTVTQVTVVKPHFVSDPGLTLPGNVQAIRETTINARSTGYLRQLFVDIGSKVKAGQVLAIVQSPDVDQQVYQAQAQTAQSRAVVGQSKAVVAQQEATVVQNMADVAHQRSLVQQARQGVSIATAQEQQSEAAEKSAEAGLSHAQEELAVQNAALKQAQAQRDLANINNTRYQTLLKQGFVAQGDADQALTTYKTSEAAVQSAQSSVDAAQADVESARAAVASAKSAVASAQANVRSSQENVGAAVAAMQSSQATVAAARHTTSADQETVRANQAAVNSNIANERHFGVIREFEKITAPFDGVITSRNVDVGMLISPTTTVTGSTTSAPQTGLLGIARMDTVRIQVNVPQTYVPELVAGSNASVTVRELPGRTFTGVVALRAGGLDSASRTQLVEVHVANPGGALVTGMYADVKITPIHPARTLRVAGTALIVDANGTRVAVVSKDNTVHLRRVTVGRDMGAEVEILKGLKGRETLVNNPPDSLQDKSQVQIVKPAAGSATKGKGSRSSDE